MYARAVDDAAERLRTLRQEECGDLGLAALALGLAVVVTQVHPELALPLFLGGLAVGALGLRAVVLRWELVERLAGERDALVIPEVLAYASREATMERRRTFAAMLRRDLREEGRLADGRLIAVADELEALAAELEDDALALDPVAAVACVRLLSDVPQSPLLNPGTPVAELRSRIRQIRSGFEPDVVERHAARVRRPTRRARS
jgi:hypothetical protein